MVRETQMARLDQWQTDGDFLFVDKNTGVIHHAVSAAIVHVGGCEQHTHGIALQYIHVITCP